MRSRSPRALKATWLATQVAGRLSTRLGGYFASRLWFTAWPVPLSERAKARHAEWISSVEPVSFETSLGRLSGFSAGVGPAILLVHGWGERAAFLGGFVSPLVHSGYRVIGVDLPAHGDSPGVETNLFELSEVLIDVVNEVGARGVVAHSMGGGVTTMAIDKGLSVDGVVLIAPAGDFNNVFAKFGSLFKLQPRVVRALRLAIERRFGEDIWDRLQLTEMVRTFETPALIVHDRDDNQIDVEDSRKLAKEWPGARLMVTSGLGHDRIMRDEEVLGATKAFLLDVIAPQGSAARATQKRRLPLGETALIRNRAITPQRSHR
jgi:pimeloyl-ACP methyl ester carboxylesterase